MEVRGTVTEIADLTIREVYSLRAGTGRGSGKDRDRLVVCCDDDLTLVFDAKAELVEAVVLLWEGRPRLNAATGRLEALAAENATLRAELDVMKHNMDSMVISQAWTAGEPPKHIREEWFIAKTIHGGRVVLRALPKEHSFDYTTEDHTYMIAKNITHWMQFPDSNYRSFVPADYDTLRDSEAAAVARVTELEASLQEIADEKFYPMGIGIEPTPTREAKMAEKALTPTTDKEPKT